MKYFVEKYFSNRQKKKKKNRWKITDPESMVSTSQNTSCPLAGIILPQQKFSSKYGFRLISIMLSTSRKKALESLPSQNDVTIKKLDTPKFTLARTWLVLRNLFFLISIILSTSGNKYSKIIFCPQPWIKNLRKSLVSM